MKLKTIVISVILGFALAAPLSAEFVFITDGSILQGKIVGDTAGSITFAAKSGETKVIPRSKIMRILYTEFYMGKIFVNKIDGSVLEVYMVDEDTNSYTFRKDINKPVEFVLKREEVLFTTRTNPVGLTGKAESETISIEWKAPYTPVKHYKVYIKSSKEYALYSEPWGKSETLKGLKSNTEYKIKVTALDKDGIESMPSNEIKVTTLNIAPNPPEKITVKKKISDNDGKMSVVVAWNNSIDIDGKIKSYKIYQKNKSEAYTTSKNEYEINDLDPKIVYTFSVSAVDDSNMESEKSKKVSIYNNPPDQPERVNVTKKIAADGKKMSALISWNNSTDVDGKIKNYKIYQKNKIEAYTSTKTEYQINNLDPEEVYFFKVSAVDETNEESDKSRRVSTYDYKGYNLSIQPNYIVPFGTFKKIHKYGCGGLISGSRANTFFEDFEVGVSLGYWQYKGVTTETAVVDYSMMIPLIFSAGYRYNIADIFYIIPHIGLGGSYNYVEYQAEPELYTGYGLAMEKRSKWSIEPLVLAGVTFEFDITHRFYIMAGGDFGMIVEMNGVVPFAMATVGAGMRF